MTVESQKAPASAPSVAVLSVNFVPLGVGSWELGV